MIQPEDVTLKVNLGEVTAEYGTSRIRGELNVTANGEWMVLLIVDSPNDARRSLRIAYIDESTYPQFKSMIERLDSALSQISANSGGAIPNPLTRSKEMCTVTEDELALLTGQIRTRKKPFVSLPGQKLHGALLELERRGIVVRVRVDPSTRQVTWTATP